VLPSVVTPKMCGAAPRRIFGKKSSPPRFEITTPE
jgi:hypothetical protein